MTHSVHTKTFNKTVIPSTWEIKELREISTITSSKRILMEEYVSSGIPFYRSKEIIEKTKGKKQLSEIYITKDKYYDIMERFGAPATNQILITAVGSLGKAYLIKEADLPFYFKDGNLLWLKDIVIENLDLEYLISFFQSNIFKRNIDDATYGSSLKALTIENLNTFKIPLPPLPEQKAIAHILGLMDEAINKNNQLIVQKELRKKWLMQNLLTGKKRLNGFNGEWKKIGAGEVFQSVSLKGFENEELLSATQDRGMIPRNMLEGRVTMPTTGIDGFKLIEPGDFVISLRSFQGGLEYSYYRGLVSPAYTVLKPKKKINDEFYKFYFKSYDFIGHLAVAVIGIRDGKQISYEDFCFVKIPYPNIKEQEAIAKVLQASDKEIQLLKTKTEKLKEQKKWLMQVLLTGKKRLNYDSSDLYDDYDSNANYKSDKSQESKKS